MSVWLFHGHSASGNPLYQGISRRYELNVARRLTYLHLQVPLHTLIKLSPRAYGCEEERYPLPIAAVDTHRPKPTRKTAANTPTRSPPTTEGSTARDYFGNDSTAQPAAHAPSQPSKNGGHLSELESLVSEKEQQARQQQAEQNGQIHKVEKVTEHNAAIHTRNHKGEFTSAVHEGIDSPSQAAMLEALTQQSAQRAQNKPPLIAFHELDQDRWDEELCTKPGNDGADPFQYNIRRIYCPREGCGSLILNAGSGDMVIDDTVVSVQYLTYSVVVLRLICDTDARG